MGDTVPIKYRAFLSYAHADARWGRWLHGRLEAYALDRDLRGTVTALGPVPKALRPIFRDREDFSGGHTLTDATIAALDASAALIVLCSAVAATRPAVNEEVRLFKSRHPGRPVIPVIIEGAPPGNFPPALRFALSPDGTVTDQPVTILAPDLRDRADGRELGLAKIVAGLTGLVPDDIFRRAERARRAANRWRAAVAVVFLAVAAAGGFFQWQSQQRGAVILQNEADFLAIRAIAEKMLAANPAAASTPGTKDNLVATLTAIQEQVAAGDTDYTKANELLKAGKGTEAVPLLIAAAQAKKRRAAAETKASAKAYREAAAIAAVAEPGKARELYAEAARLDPDDLEGMLQHAERESGAGDFATAERAYGLILTLGRSGRDDFHLILAHWGLGDALARQRKLELAIEQYRIGGAAYDSLGTSDSTRQRLLPNLVIFYLRFGEILKQYGNVSGSFETFQRALVISHDLQKAHPDDAEVLRLLAACSDHVAAAEFEQGHPEQALAFYRGSLDMRQRLASSSPQNAARQHDLAVSYDDVGNILLDQGKAAEALTLYKAALVIRTRLFQPGLGDPDWQGDLAISHMRIAGVAAKLGDKATAKSELVAARAVSARLATLSPSNPNWKNDLIYIDEQLAALEND